MASLRKIISVGAAAIFLSVNMGSVSLAEEISSYDDANECADLVYEEMIDESCESDSGDETEEYDAIEAYAETALEDYGDYTVTMASVQAVSASVTSKNERLYTCADYNGQNIEKQNYINSTVPDLSYLTELSDGSLLRFQGADGNGGYYAQYFDANLNYVSEKRIDAELGEFGAFHYDGTYFYILTGQDNTDKSNSAEVYRVTQYDSTWKRIRSKSFYGEDTKTAFNWGSAHMVSDGNQLFVRTCHEMYNGHQANMNMSINTTDMSGRVVSGGYVSHSFEQFIRMDNGYLCTVDHGDAYPRAIYLTRFSQSYKSDPDGYDSTDVNVISFADGTWETGASLGGFEISATHYVIAGNINDQSNQADSKTCNVWLATVDKSKMSSAGVRLTMLTDFKEGETGANTPRLVKMGSDGFMLLWSVDEQVYYCMLNSAGEVVGSTYTFSGNLSDCNPVYYNGRVIWYTFNEGETCFYSISKNSIGSVAIDKKVMGHDYVYTDASASNKYVVRRYCTKCNSQETLTALSGFWTFFQNNSSSFDFSYMSAINVECGDNLEFLIQFKEPDNADLYQVICSSSDEKIAKERPGTVNNNGETRGSIILGQGNGGDVETAILTFKGFHSSFSRTLKVTVTHHYEFSEKIPASPGKNAVNRYVCPKCGGVRDKVIEGEVYVPPAPEVSAMAASLSTNVCAIFEMKNLPEDGYVVAEGKFGTVKTAVKDLKLTNDIYEFRCEIAIKYMGDSGTIQIVDADSKQMELNEKGSGLYKLSWNIHDYLKYIRDKYINDSVVVNLVDSYIAYSDEAAKYFGVRTPDAEHVYGSTSGLNAYAKNIPTVVNGMQTQIPDGLTYAGSSLITDNQVRVRHYFIGDISGCTITVDNVSCDFMNVGENLYYIESEKIDILSLDVVKTIRIDKEKQHWEMRYYPLSYCYDAITATAGTLSSGENLIRFAKSLYLYSVAAEKYNSSERR